MAYKVNKTEEEWKKEEGKRERGERQNETERERKKGGIYGRKGERRKREWV